MKQKKKSPGELRQAKITSFCSFSNVNRENLGSSSSRKRKNEEEVHEVHYTPVKRVAKSDSKSPDLLHKSSRKVSNEDGSSKKVQTELDFEDLDFEDFENDPFLSPSKTISPKKNILTENSSENEILTEETEQINFDVPTKCTVIKATFVREKHFEQVLQLTDVTSNKGGTCRLREIWTSFTFSAGDVVSVEAVSSEGLWVVDNKHGYVILHPDIMISSTSLTCSMFCMRKGLLSYYFKETDSEGTGRMLIGRLVHELFQYALKTSTSSEEDLRKIVTLLMNSRKNFYEFVCSDLNVLDIEKELINFIPRIKSFIDTYLKKEMVPTGRNFGGGIDEIVDIEELIKSPSLGCQGRIDVTVKMRTKKEQKIVPLELKTGKSSFSAEHRAQLSLYILLMNELGRNIDSGLLLYLRDDVMEEVFLQRDQIRNLLVLRNHFVNYCKSLGSGILPDPIRNVKACMKCSHLRVCSTYLKGGDCNGLSETYPLGCMEIPDLKPSHVNYFVKWNKMLCLEYSEVLEDVANEWEISSLSLEPNVETLKDELKYSFRKNSKSEDRWFRPGTLVYFVDGKNNRVAAGHILEVTESLISVLTEKRLSDFSSSYKLVVTKPRCLHFYFNSLGQLLGEEFKNLRELIIDKREPIFDKSFDKADFQEKCVKHLLDLNKEQREAILKSLLCQDYLLIKGPPGTGKTQTILHLIKILLEFNKTVLIAGHTHSSVDNILLRLSGVDYLRLGSLKNIRPEIHKNSFTFLIENCSGVDDVKRLFERKLIASTCMGIDTDFIRKVKVDYCIIDESSQVLQPEILRPLFCCKKFILVGDEAQLSPIVRNPQAKKLGMDKSMFEWLYDDRATVKLRLQYRMNSVINSLANAITYDGLIECGNEEVAKATMKVPNGEVYQKEEEWIVEVLSDDLEKSVVFVDTSEYFQSNKPKLKEKRCSKLEANIAIRLITSLIKFGLEEENIGVITPFGDQIILLREKLVKENLHKVELNTVDQYQGRDKEVILFSCTKENQAEWEASEAELLNNERRLTVAVTRAKYKLIILGDKQTVSKYKPFQKLIKSLSGTQFFTLSGGQKNFFWENFENNKPLNLQ